MKISNNSPLTSEQIQSQTISWLRFPLIVAIVVTHVGLSQAIIAGENIADLSSNFVYHNFEFVARIGIAYTAVPLFFFISGFLFFYRIDFDFTVYLDKLRKRFWSLLIPYLIWTVFAVVIRFAGETAAPSMLPGTMQLLKDYSITDLVISTFWANLGDYKLYPIASQFWFIRDLMICCICTPIIFCLLRNIKIFSVLILCILYLLTSKHDKLPGISAISFFFFTFGAYFSVYKYNFASFCSKYLWLFLLLFIALLGITWYLWHIGNEWFHFYRRLGFIPGVLTITGLVARGIAAGRLHVVPCLASAAFFIFAYHNIGMPIWNRLYLKLIYPCSEFELFVGFFGITIFVVCLGLCLYWLLHRLFPRFTTLICGGR